MVYGDKIVSWLQGAFGTNQLIGGHSMAILHGPNSGALLLCDKERRLTPRYQLGDQELFVILALIRLFCIKRHQAQNLHFYTSPAAPARSRY